MESERRRELSEALTNDEKRAKIREHLARSLVLLQTLGPDAVDAFVFAIQWNEESGKGAGITIDTAGPEREVVQLIASANAHILFGN